MQDPSVIIQAREQGGSSVHGGWGERGGGKWLASGALLFSLPSFLNVPNEDTLTWVHFCALFRTENPTTARAGWKSSLQPHTWHGEGPGQSW